MSRTSADFLIRDADLLVTCAGPAPRRGREQQNEIAAIPRGSVAAHRGRIVFAGRAVDLASHTAIEGDATIIDASGCTVLPGFVDPHTHVLYAGDRSDELRRRLRGVPYAQIAAEGGGILSTVRATRDASPAALAAMTRRRLDEMLRAGTTTCEVKSGYGLTAASELALLGTIGELDAVHPIDLVPTFMGAHETPPEHRASRARYVDVIVEEMIPAVAAAAAAEWCDVFCEDGVFTPDESIRILEAGSRAGLKPRIHADELGPSGGWRAAVAAGARSADHLLFVSDEGGRALARAGTIATLLPAAAFYLKLGRYAPARSLMDAGVPIALGTDVNPGGGFSPSMPFAMTVACFAMDMTLEESIVGATINAACSLDRERDVGSLEAGKLMDAVIVEGGPIDLLRAGARAVRAVVKRGRLAVDNGSLGPWP